MSNTICFLASVTSYIGKVTEIDTIEAFNTLSGTQVLFRELPDNDFIQSIFVIKMALYHCSFTELSFQNCFLEKVNFRI